MKLFNKVLYTFSLIKFKINYSFDPYEITDNNSSPENINEINSIVSDSAIIIPSLLYYNFNTKEFQYMSCKLAKFSKNSIIEYIATLYQNNINYLNNGGSYPLWNHLK